MVIYLGKSTLGKREDPNIMKTDGHRIQVDTDTQSPGISSWNPVRVGPGPVSQMCVRPVQSHRILHLEGSNKPPKSFCD